MFKNRRMNKHVPSPLLLAINAVLTRQLRQSLDNLVRRANLPDLSGFDVADRWLTARDSLSYLRLRQPFALQLNNEVLNVHT